MKIYIHIRLTNNLELEIYTISTLRRILNYCASEALPTILQTKKEGKERRQKRDYCIIGFDFFICFVQEMRGYQETLTE